jgi:hypothetical protein
LTAARASSKDRCGAIFSNSTIANPVGLPDAGVSLRLKYSVSVSLCVCILMLQFYSLHFYRYFAFGLISIRSVRPGHGG